MKYFAVTSNGSKPKYVALHSGNTTRALAVILFMEFPFAVFGGYPEFDVKEISEIPGGCHYYVMTGNWIMDVKEAVSDAPRFMTKNEIEKALGYKIRIVGF